MQPNRLEIEGPGDHFGDSDFRHFASGDDWICNINWEGKLEFSVDDYEHESDKFDMEEFENHKITLFAKPTREDYYLLHKIVRTIIRYGSAKIWSGTKFLDELRCDGSFWTIVTSS